MNPEDKAALERLEGECREYEMPGGGPTPRANVRSADLAIALRLARSSDVLAGALNETWSAIGLPTVLGRRAMTDKRDALKHFVRESNRIEGILRDPTQAELDAHASLLALGEIHVADLVGFVAVIAPGKPLRTERGMNVRVGPHVSPPGGTEILPALEAILDRANNIRDESDSYFVHHEYETLHPFIDGNGRSGRALWLWMRSGYAPLGFLHHWYYQSLQFGGKR